MVSGPSERVIASRTASAPVQPTASANWSAKSRADPGRFVGSMASAAANSGASRVALRVPDTPSSRSVNCSAVPVARRPVSSS